MDGINTSYSAPCLVTFQEQAVAGPRGLVTMNHRLLFTFYKGDGRVAVVKIEAPGSEVGIPMLKAISDTMAGLQKSCRDVFPFQYECPGSPEKPCGNKAVEITLDRRNDGFAILRLRCPQCGKESIYDVRTLDTRMLCEGCGIAKANVRLATDAETGAKRRLCDECFKKGGTR